MFFTANNEEFFNSNDQNDYRTKAEDLTQQCLDRGMVSDDNESKIKSEAY